MNAESTMPASDPEHHRADELLEQSKQYIRDALNLLTGDEATTALGPDTVHRGKTVEDLRANGHLIGLPATGCTYLYPSFQFDAGRQRIHPVVARINRVLRADIDPYGAASWWLTPTDILDSRSPLDELTYGTLTDIAVDNILAAQRRGM